MAFVEERLLEVCNEEGHDLFFFYRAILNHHEAPWFGNPGSRGRRRFGVSWCNKGDCG